MTPGVPRTGYRKIFPKSASRVTRTRNGVRTDDGVTSAGQSYFSNCNRVVTQSAKPGRLPRRQILIKEKGHASARTTSSPAKAAAY
jgi:hypothetical protein